MELKRLYNYYHIGIHKFTLHLFYNVVDSLVCLTSSIDLLAKRLHNLLQHLQKIREWLFVVQNELSVNEMSASIHASSF